MPFTRRDLQYHNDSELVKRPDADCRAQRPDDRNQKATFPAVLAFFRFIPKSGHPPHIRRRQTSANGVTILQRGTPPMKAGRSLSCAARCAVSVKPKAAITTSKPHTNSTSEDASCILIRCFPGRRQKSGAIVDFAGTSRLENIQLNFKKYA
jgi:hypothetical protein